MAIFQKIKELFLDDSPKGNSILNKISDNSLKSISISIFLIIFYIIIYGLFFDLYLTFISLFYFALYIIFFLLKKSNNLSDKNFKIITFLLVSLIIFSLYFKPTDKMPIFYFFFIPIFSYILFQKDRMLFLNFSVLIIFDIFYFIFETFHFLDIQNVIELNIIFLLLNFIFYFFKKIETENIENHKKSIYTEQIKIEQEQKIIAFALHQLRSTVNNYTVFEETEKKIISDKENTEIEKIKKQSLESLCASFSLLENIGGKEDKFIANCRLDNVIEKIFSFYKLNQRNIKIINLNQNTILNRKTDHQIIILKSLFITFEIINQIIGGNKTNINFEFNEDESFFSYKFNFKNEFEEDNLTPEKLKVMSKILHEILQPSESNFIFFHKKNITTSIQLNFKKKYFFVKTNSVNEQKKEIIDHSIYKLLLGEDDEINQKIYSIGFEKYFDKIEIADNGSEILKKLERAKYNLLVMDLQMPTMNGIETIEKIRKIEKLTGEHLLVIAITANTLIYNRTDILNFGFDDYFIKPFKVKEIYQSFLNLKNKS